jgi:hypothetical protein
LLSSQLFPPKPKPIRGKEKGKGRGKKSDLNYERLQEEDSIPGTSQAQPSQYRSMSTYSNFTEDSSRASVAPSANIASSVQQSTTKNVYIRKVDCFLNSVSIDQIEDNENEDECMQAYWRLFQANGQINSLVTNGISYNDFRYLQYTFIYFKKHMYVVLYIEIISFFSFSRNGFFFAAFDLSTSGKSGTGFVVPSIRVGHLKFRVLLSDALPMDVAMLLFCEFPSTLFLSKEHGIASKSKVTKSFTPR